MISNWLYNYSSCIQTIASILNVAVALFFGVITTILILRDKKNRALLRAMQKTNKLLLQQQLPSLSVDSIGPTLEANNVGIDLKNVGGDLYNLKAKYNDSDTIQMSHKNLARGETIPFTVNRRKEYLEFQFNDSGNNFEIKQKLFTHGTIHFEPIYYKEKQILVSPPLDN